MEEFIVSKIQIFFFPKLFLLCSFQYLLIHLYLILIFVYMQAFEKHKHTPKKIIIQKLDPRPQIQTVNMDEKQLIRIMNWKYRWASSNVLCYKDTGISEERVKENESFLKVSSFFEAFLHAYTQHGDIYLVPDQIWIMIIVYISKYIDENAEKLRGKLVKHEGIKILTVTQYGSSQEESLLLQKNWDNFFEEIIKKIEKQTVEGVVQIFACNFSTTNKTYKMISTSVIMNSMKRLFNYHRRFCICGINNVYMDGNRQDWIKMIGKLQAMVKFDVDGKLKQYIQHMKVILNNFLLTFDQKPDVPWWNTIMKRGQTEKIYGGQKTQISGWILNFFGLYQKTQIAGFPEMTIKVPIKMISQITQREKSLLLISDWVSISKLDERTYKPDLGICIFQVGEKFSLQLQNPNQNN